MKPLCRLLLFAGLTVFTAIARPAAAQAPPTQLGPVVLRTDDGWVSLQPQLVSQLRLTVVDRERASRERASTTLDLHRLRTGARLGFDDLVTVALQLDVAPRSPELIDAWVELELDDLVQVRAGQMKVPFTRYWEQSIARLGMVDWPIAVRYFGGEHQLGIMVHDMGRHEGGIEYAAGVFGGENRRGAHARELPALYGQVHGNPSSLRDAAAPRAPHPEWVGRITHRSAGVPASTGMPRDLVSDASGALRHAVSVSVAADLGAERGRDHSLRVAPEVRLEGLGVSVTAVGYAGFVPTARAPVEPGMVGAMLEAIVRAHRHLELAVRFVRVALLRDLREDIRAAVSEAQPCPSAAQDSAMHARQELGLGLGVPVLGHSLVFTSDVTWLRSEQLDGDHDGLRVRGQLQLAL